MFWKFFGGKPRSRDPCRWLYKRVLVLQCIRGALVVFVGKAVSVALLSSVFAAAGPAVEQRPAADGGDPYTVECAEDQLRLTGLRVTVGFICCFALLVAAALRAGARSARLQALARRVGVPTVEMPLDILVEITAWTANSGVQAVRDQLVGAGAGEGGGTGSPGAAAASMVAAAAVVCALAGCVLRLRGCHRDGQDDNDDAPMAVGAAAGEQRNEEAASVGAAAAAVVHVPSTEDLALHALGLCAAWELAHAAIGTAGAYALLAVQYVLPVVAIQYAVRLGLLGGLSSADPTSGRLGTAFGVFGFKVICTSYAFVLVAMIAVLMAALGLLSARELEATEDPTYSGARLCGALANLGYTVWLATKVFGISARRNERMRQLALSSAQEGQGGQQAAAPACKARFSEFRDYGLLTRLHTPAEGAARHAVVVGSMRTAVGWAFERICAAALCGVSSGWGGGAHGASTTALAIAWAYACLALLLVSLVAPAMLRCEARQQGQLDLARSLLLGGGEDEHDCAASSASIELAAKAAPEPDEAARAATVAAVCEACGIPLEVGRPACSGCGSKSKSKSSPA
jgi:hypothetical protein